MRRRAWCRCWSLEVEVVEAAEPVVVAAAVAF